MRATTESDAFLPTMTDLSRELPDDEAALVAAIHDDPAADDPRLVYADWLEERGDPRSEFIRLQCELFGMTDEDPRHRDLTKRELKFLHEHKERWIGPIIERTRSAHLYRGFVDRIAVQASQFPKHAEQLFEWAPITRVKLIQLTGKSVGAVAKVPELANIEHLRIAGTKLDDNGWRTFLGSPHLVGLRELEAPNALDILGTTALRECASAGSIERLDLSVCELGGEAIEALAAATEFESLRNLDVHLNRFDYAGIEALAAAVWLPRLEHLHLDAHTVSLDPLGRTGAVSALRSLHIQGTNSAAGTILESPYLSSLESLAIDFTGFGDEDLAGVARARSLPRLEHLSARWGRVTGAGLQRFLSGDHVPPLTRLVLDHNRGIGPQGAVAIARSLRPIVLNLHNCVVEDAGAIAIAESPNMAGLRKLSLAGNGLTDRSARAILDSPHLGGLVSLDLRGNRIGKDLQKALRKRHGVGVCSFSAR